MSLHLEQSLIVDATDYHVGIINGKYDQPEGSPASFRRLKALKNKTSIKQVSKQRNNPYFFKYKREDYKTNDRAISQNNNRYNGNPYNKGRKWPELQSHNYNNNLAHNYVNYYYPNDEFIQYRNFDSIQNYTKEFSNNDIIIVLLRLKKADLIFLESIISFLYIG
jgi:hypothetical protein